MALAGHNGAGKSTLIKLILGLIRPSAGRVALFGHDAHSPRAAQLRARVGYLPETVALHPSMTGAETLAFYARLKRQPLSANAALLERVGIAAASGRRVGGYSRACASAWRWRRRCWASRKCCCWTNPPPAWTRPRASCSTASSPSCARPAPPSCSARTPCPSWPDTPTASWS